MTKTEKTENKIDLISFIDHYLIGHRSVRNNLLDKALVQLGNEDIAHSLGLDILGRQLPQRHNAKTSSIVK